MSGAKHVSWLPFVTDIHCLRGRISFLLLLPLFLRKEGSHPSLSLSPQRRAASVQFQMDSDGMSLLRSLSASSLPRDLPSFSRLLAKSLSAASEGVFYVEDFDRPQTRHECRLVFPMLLQPAWRAVIFCPFKRHKVRLSAAPATG